MEVDLDRPHRARAALGDDVRDRGGAARARAWIVRALAEWRARRRDVMPREWKSGAPILYRGRELALEVFPARRARIAPDLFNLTVLHPHAQDEAEVAELVGKWLRDEAWALVAPRVAAYARTLARAGARAAPVERAQRMGKLQRARRDPPQLAAGAAAAGARRIRRRARGRAPGRAQPLAALLGGGRDADAGARRRCGASSRTGRRCSPPSVVSAAAARTSPPPVRLLAQQPRDSVASSVVARARVAPAVAVRAEVKSAGARRHPDLAIRRRGG